MKVSYMLLNKSGKARKIPPGQAWQWTFHIEDTAQLEHVWVQLKRDIRENRLALANLRIQRHKLDVEIHGGGELRLQRSHHLRQRHCAQKNHQSTLRRSTRQQ